MILPYDPFGKNRMVYTAKTRLIEEPEIDYDDGAATIYLYTKGTEGKPGQKLQDMLNYIQNSVQENVKNKDLEEIRRLVTEIKQDEEVGISYMKSWEWERYIEERSREEGRNEGRKEGERTGRRAPDGAGFDSVQEAKEELYSAGDCGYVGAGGVRNSADL